MEWRYTYDWSEEEMLNGSYCGFVYLFQFEDGYNYIGSKQLYKGVKNAKDLDSSSVLNDFGSYSSSSKVVNERINNGMPYVKTILWCFPTMRDTTLVENILIMNEGLKESCLNLAVRIYGRLPASKDKKRLYGIVRELLEILN